MLSNIMYKTFLLFVFSIVCTNAYTTNTIKPLKRTVITFSSATGHKIYAAIKECAESKTAEFMKIVREGKYREDDEFKRFIHCSYYKSGYSYEDGRVKVESSAHLYPDPVAILKVLKRCDAERGCNPVDTTFAFFKCFQDRTPFLIGT